MGRVLCWRTVFPEFLYSPLAKYFCTCLKYEFDKFKDEPLSLVHEYKYDMALGSKISSYLDPNGLETRFDYDTLARLTSYTMPGNDKASRRCVAKGSRFDKLQRRLFSRKLF